MCQHRRDKALLKRQQKLKTAQLKKQRIEEKQEQKRRKKIRMKIAVIETRIDLWKTHLEEVKNENAARV